MFLALRFKHLMIKYATVCILQYCCFACNPSYFTEVPWKWRQYVLCISINFSH